MRHVIMHPTAPKPHECCFLINIEVLFIATGAVSEKQEDASGVRAETLEDRATQMTALPE